jgi:hypothetical protein
MVRLPVEAGGNVNATNDFGDTPLGDATRAPTQRLLEAHGAH